MRLTKIFEHEKQSLYLTIDFDPVEKEVSDIISVEVWTGNVKTDLTKLYYSGELSAHLDELVGSVNWPKMISEARAERQLARHF